jgi:ATP-dependent DNA ligase
VLCDCGPSSTIRSRLPTPWYWRRYGPLLSRNPRTRILTGPIYLNGMLRKREYQPCIPTRGTKVPGGPDWFHEIKHDGYRLIVQREGRRVRLLTRHGYDWSDRYPLIVQSALRLRKRSFVIGGEAVVLGPDGISDFEALHVGKRNAEVRLYAFDLLMDDGVDMRDHQTQG